MGYTTDFWGEFEVTPQLKPEHIAYLKAFATTRRMRRDAAKVALLPDPIREAVGLPVGLEGGYYVGDTEPFGQGRTDDILDYNRAPGEPDIPPSDDPEQPMKDWSERYNEYTRLKKEAEKEGGAQPGLWCQWVPTDGGEAIVWDEGEKFYDYIPWIRYLITNFLEPWGYKLNGSVIWEGEDSDDRGKIVIENNVVMIGRARVEYDFG